MELFLRFICAFVLITFIGCESKTEKETVIKATEIAEPVLLSTEINAHPGQFFEYEFRKMKSQTGKPTEDGTGPVRIDVVESDTEGTVFLYHQIIEIPESEKDTLLGEMMRMGDFVMRVHADPAWESFKILNFDDLHPRFIRIAELLYATQEPSIPISDREGIKEAMIGMFRNRDFTYSIAMKPIYQLFTIVGWSGYESSPRQIESTLENPFGGPLLPATINVALFSTDKASDTRISYSQEYKPKMVGDMLKGMMTQITQDMGIQVPGFEWDPNSLDLKDELNGIVDNQLGFIKRCQFTRTIKMSDPTGQSSGERVELYGWILKNHGVVKSDTDTDNSSDHDKED